MYLMGLGRWSVSDPTLKIRDMKTGADQVPSITLYVTVYNIKNSQYLVPDNNNVTYIYVLLVHNSIHGNGRGWEFSMSPLCPPDLKWKMEGCYSGRTNSGQSKVRRQTQLVNTKF